MTIQERECMTNEVGCNKNEDIQGIDLFFILRNLEQDSCNIDKNLESILDEFVDSCHYMVIEMLSDSKYTFIINAIKNDYSRKKSLKDKINESIKKNFAFLNECSNLHAEDISDGDTILSLLTLITDSVYENIEIFPETVDDYERFIEDNLSDDSILEYSHENAGHRFNYIATIKILEIILDSYSYYFENDQKFHKIFPVHDTPKKVQIHLIKENFIKLFRILSLVHMYKKNKYSYVSNPIKILKLVALFFSIDSQRWLEIDFFNAQNIPLLRSLSSSYGMSIGRWKDQNFLYQEAIKTADKRWSSGDERTHEEMANVLLKYKEFSFLSKGRMLKELKEIAIKYNKVRGLKKQA